MAQVKPWEHYRFDALVEAARIFVFGEQYTQSRGYENYISLKASRIPIVMKTFFFEE